MFIYCHHHHHISHYHSDHIFKIGVNGLQKFEWPLFAYACVLFNE